MENIFDQIKLVLSKVTSFSWVSEKNLFLILYKHFEQMKSTSLWKTLQKSHFTVNFIKFSREVILQPVKCKNPRCKRQFKNDVIQNQAIFEPPLHTVLQNLHIPPLCDVTILLISVIVYKKRRYGWYEIMRFSSFELQAIKSIERWHTKGIFASLYGLWILIKYAKVTLKISIFKFCKDFKESYQFSNP